MFQLTLLILLAFSFAVFSLKDSKSDLLTLSEVALTLETVTDKIAYHQYGAFYDRWLESARRSTDEFHLLEIGLGCYMTFGEGASLLLWTDERVFPNANALINILEFDEACVRRNQQKYPKTINFFVGDQSSRTDLRKLVKSLGTMDFIIDDGGHSMNQQQTSLLYLFNHGLNPGGVYIIEDLHTSWINSSINYLDTKLRTADRIESWISSLLHEHPIPELPDLAEISCAPKICAIVKKKNFNKKKIIKKI